MNVKIAQIEVSQFQAFADGLKEAMRRKGWNTPKLAEASGVPQKSLYNYVQGRTAPDFANFRDLFLALSPYSNLLLPLLVDNPVMHSDGYYKLREDLEKVITSGQSQLIGQAEETLDRLAESARYMTGKSRKRS